MKESTLWKHLRPALERRGHFQKVSDRFTGGIPDCLGSCRGIPMAMEFKDFSGVHVWKVKFRPGQLDWLRDWKQNGKGVSWILCTSGRVVYAFGWEQGEALERGVTPGEAWERATFIWEKSRKDSWLSFVDVLLDHSTG